LNIIKIIQNKKKKIRPTRPELGPRPKTNPPETALTATMAWHGPVSLKAQLACGLPALRLIGTARQPWRILVAVSAYEAPLSAVLG
jgi:hypothetical protein